jgi:hypothetical protein
MDEWLALLEAVAALHQRDGIALVAIDSLNIDRDIRRLSMTNVLFSRPTFLP